MTAGTDMEAAHAQLGHFRLYQKYMLVLLCVPHVLAAMYTHSYMFVAHQVPFRCSVPECEGDADQHYDNGEALALLPADESCRRYALLPAACCRAPLPRRCYNTSDTVPCERFVYENMNTIFSEFNLACREWRRGPAGAGPLGLVLTGYLSDGWGRRTALCATAVFAGVMGLLESFSVDRRMYVAVEFLEEALGRGFDDAGYVMAIESARPSLRAAFACATGVARGAGGVLLACAARAVPRWRELLRWIHAPALLLAAYRLLLDESPRWLHARGRGPEAARALRKAAGWNGIALDEDVLKRLGDEKTSTNPWLEVVESRRLSARLALCCFCWAAVAFVRHGLSVSVSDDLYAGLSIDAGTETVAALIVMMALERFGRKRCIVVSYLACGAACVVPYFVVLSGAGPGLYFAGKLTIAFASHSATLHTAELFPTGSRTSALVVCALCARLGSALGPQTESLGQYVQMVLYGSAALTGALLVLLMPETRRALLPQTVAEAETLGPAPALSIIS